MDPQWVLTAVIGGATVVASYLTVRVARHRLEDEAPERLTKTALSLIKPLEDRIKHLEVELQIQRDERTKLAERVKVLESFIRLNTEFDPEHI